MKKYNKQGKIFKSGDTIKSNRPKDRYCGIFSGMICGSEEVYIVSHFDESGMMYLEDKGGSYFEMFFDLVYPLYLTIEEISTLKEFLIEYGEKKQREKEKEIQTNRIKLAKQILEESGECNSCLKEYDKTKEVQ